MKDKSNSTYINTSFILDSIEAWEEDEEKRFNLDKLNTSFHESVPVLKFIDWKITNVKRGFAETVLPIDPSSSNQYITHQAALMLLAADYTGGIALASLFHLTPIVGFHAPEDNRGIYMWGAKASIKWFSPSCKNLICRATIDEDKRCMLSNRLRDNKRVTTTITIEMFNGKELVAESQFTYWVQSTQSLQKDAFDMGKISILYKHKVETTAKLISGLRALEKEKPKKERRFDDQWASVIAQKHGITLARRFSAITPQLQDMVSIRTEHLDGNILEFIKKEEAINIINIGAGYDSRLWRLDIGDFANIYELDLPIMLNQRKKIFNYNKRKNIHAVPIDLINQTIAEVMLNQEGFNLFLPTFFIWEGGTMYFKEEAGDIFQSISKIMNNRSILWFDYVTQDSIDDKTGIKEVGKFINSMRKMGEPFINGFNNIESFAKKHGLFIKSDEKSSKYTTSNDKIYEHYKICTLGKK